MRVPVIAILVVSLITILADTYIYFYVRNRSRRNKRHTRIYAATAAVCWLFLIVAFCLPRRNGDSSILPVMWMLYAYLTIYISKFIFILTTAAAMVSRIWTKNKRHSTAGLIVALALSLTAFFTLWWGTIWGRREIQVTQYTMASPKIPKSFDGYRIVQFSDIHLGTWGNDTTFVSRFVDSINAVKPDLILFTGDIVNRNTSELKPFICTLSQLHAPDGVYGVLGNHDYGLYQEWNSEGDRIKNCRLLGQYQRQMGWKMLNNDYAFLTRGSDSIPLIGVENWGEYPFGEYGDLRKAYPETGKTSLNDGRFKILMSHNPEHWRQIVAKSSNIDLTLSGHTHAMQMIFKIGNWRWSPSQLKYEEWAGDFHKKGLKGEPMTCYVNIGCGEVGLPYRIGAAPEITVITLSSTAAK